MIPEQQTPGGLRSFRTWLLADSTERFASKVAERRFLYLAFFLIVILVSLDNLVTNLWSPEEWYVPIRLTTVALCYMLLRLLTTVKNSDLGVSKLQLKEGLKPGLVVVLITFVGYGALLAMPATRGFFEDSRVAGKSFPQLLYTVIVSVPVGTAFAEEFIFRGIFLALITRLWNRPLGVVLSSLLFGLWHIAPAWNITTVNPEIAQADVSRLSGVLFAVCSTFFVGLWFCWLRLRFDSLTAPFLAHLASNDLGYFFSKLAMYLSWV